MASDATILHLGQDPHVDCGTFGKSADEGCDPWDWEVWVDGGMVILNLSRPGSGIYEVSTGLTIEEADQLGRAIATGQGRLLKVRGGDDA